jgi:hypothetical protein
MEDQLIKWLIMITILGITLTPIPIIRDGETMNCSYKSPSLNQLKQTVGSLIFRNNLTSLKNAVWKIQLNFFSRHNIKKNEEFKRNFFKLAMC